MNDDQALFFWGALKITRSADSVGVPVFTVIGGNAMYVCEMDPYFKIISFMHFSQDNLYKVDTELPTSAREKFYRIGDPAPIPYWLDGKCHFISGDAEERDVFRAHGRVAIDNEVLRDLRQYLDDARNGVFREEQERWMVREISANFHDIFHEIPVHSSYWIRRLGEAVRYARTKTTPPHPVDDELRRVALDWIERFASKTDYDRIMGVIDNLLQGAIPTERAQSMVFAFLVNKVSSGNFSMIERKISKDARFRRLFPEGLYQYWWENNWPRLPFEYKKPYHLLDPLRAEIRQGEIKEDFHRAERMAFLCFARQKASQEIDELVWPIINRYLDKLRNAVYKSEPIFLDPSKRRSWQPRAVRILYLYHMLMSLDGIIDGTHRLSRAIVDERFGLSQYYVQDLERMANI